MTENQNNNSDNRTLDEVLEEVDKNFSEKFEKLRIDTTRSLQYDDSDGLDIQLIKCHSACMRFNDIHAKEKHFYNRIKSKYDRMYAEMIDVAKQNPLMYRTSNEIDGFIIRDTRVARAKAIVQNQLEMLEYLQSVMDMLKSKRFDIKTLLEIRKTEFGKQM